MLCDLFGVCLSPDDLIVLLLFVFVAGVLAVAYFGRNS